MPKLIKIVHFTLLSCLLLAQSGYCMPAVQSVQQLEQPDGNTFAARRWGDESAHGWETLDGYTVIKDPTTNYWHYAFTDDATQELTAGLVVGASRLAASFEKHQRPQNTASLRRYEVSALRSGFGAPARMPVSGARRLPVMMINFNDTAATFDAADFDDLLFGSGNNSMKEYYEEVSYGAFTITPGGAGVTGWYAAGRTMDYYGENDASGYDRHPAELVIETVAAADAAVDFSEYDTDGDCYVDTVVIIHQGPGEEAWGSSDTIWSHRWSLNSAAYFGDGTGQYTTDDTAACGQIRINEYIIQPETLLGGIQTIGVFAHEFGHVMGLPDLYDIDYSSNGIGDWGLMGSGAWGAVSRPGDTPVHMCAWSKHVLGWVDPVIVSSQLIDEVIDPVGTSGDVYQFFPNGQTDGQEYYLIENRQRIGFDAGLPGTGLAVWHVDEDRATYNNRDNSQECVPDTDCTDTHYRVALIQADGYADLESGYNRGDSGDLYPGASGNTALSTTTTPDSLLYDGSPGGVNISDITEAGETITATLAIGYSISATATGSGRITPEGDTIITSSDDWTFAIIPDHGFQILNVYIDDTPVGTVTEYTFSNVQQDHRIRAEFSPLSGADALSGNGSAASSGGSGGSGGCFISAVFD